MFDLTAKFQKKVMNGFREKALQTVGWTDERTDGRGLNSRFFRILRRNNYTRMRTKIGLIVDKIVLLDYIL